jgi:YggT family protein
VSNLLITFALVREVLKNVLLWAALIVAAVATIDWLVRTRRFSPFGPVARFFRERVDPWLEPVERRVVRAGGLPASAPWWALGGIVVGGVILLALIDFLGGLLVDVARGVDGGPSGIVGIVIYWGFAILRIAIIVRVLSSWLPTSPYSRWVRWSFTLTEPLLQPLRRVIPLIRSIDITPIVAFFAIGIVEGLVRGWLG